nr:MAG TPA: Chromatin remodeling complex ATPase [Caudoviricetes sp.]
MQLFPHQSKALDETKDFKRVAYYLDMGLGKTFVGGEKAKQLDKPLLVICQKSKIEDWVQHLVDIAGYDTFDLTDKKEMEFFMQVLNGDPETANKTAGVINYDLIFRRSYFAHITGFTLMLDESSIIQNEAAKRSKFILKMQPENVILLSGTPTAGKYEKLWSQLRLLGWNISKDLFYKQYVEMEWIEDHNSGFRIPHVVGYKNVDRLKKKLAEHGAIFMKSEEVFDLPEQMMIPIHSKPTKEYRKFMRDEVITIEGREFIGDTILSKRIYSRMMCSYLNRERVAAFKDLVQSTEDRLIVFYNFNEELNTMQAALAELERPFSVVNGETKDLTAYEEHGDSITFVQYQAGAMGLNLQKANKIIYFSLTDRSELFEQSKKRIHRIGQEKPCFYYLMICPGTVEEDILHTLELRKDYTDELFKKYQEGFDW